MNLIAFFILFLPLLSWSQSECHHTFVAPPTVENAIPENFISGLTAVQDRVAVSLGHRRNDSLVCHWLQNYRRSFTVSPNDELPQWSDEIERRFTRTSLAGRAFNAFGTSLIKGVNALYGFTPARMSEILNELPEEMAEFERATPNLRRCAPLFQKVSDKCLKGNTNMAELYVTVKCGRGDSTECLKTKCGIDIQDGELESCKNIVPLNILQWVENKERFKYTSFMTGLYTAKNEPGETKDHLVPGESSQQRVVRRTINHVMEFLTPNNDVPDRVDTPIQAFERGGTNCLGYALMINSGLKYTTAGTGVKTEIMTHVTPAHAWSRIELTEPEMTFDIDGSQYGLHFKPGTRPTHEFFPLPPRDHAARSECPTEAPSLPFCTANVSGSELTGERGNSNSLRRTSEGTASRQ